MYAGSVRALAVTLIVCCGCDQVWGLSRSNADGSLDVDGQGLPTLCEVASPPPLLCYDFDDQTLAGYTNGSPFVPSLTLIGVSQDRRMPGVSAPNGLWIENGSNSAGSAELGNMAVPVPSGRVRATFSVNNATATTEPHTLAKAFQIVFQDSDVFSFATLRIDLFTRKLAMDFVAGSGSPLETSVVALPAGWVPITVELDLPARRFVVVAANTSALLALPATNPSPSATMAVVFGLSPALSGDAIGFDNILVTAL